MNKLTYISEEEMQEQLQKSINGWKKGYSRDGFVQKAKGIFEYKGIKYLIKINRYFNHMDRFIPMSRRISDCHVVVEYPEETKPIVDLVSEIEGIYNFLYHDTLHSWNDNQTLEEQVEICHKLAKEDIDSLLDGVISNKINESMAKLKTIKDELNALAVDSVQKEKDE